MAVLVVVLAPALAIALALGNTDVVIDLLTNGGIVLYGVGVWSANFACSGNDAANKPVLSPL